MHDPTTIAVISTVALAILGVLGKWLQWSLKQALRETSAGTRDILGRQIEALNSKVDQRHTANLGEFRKLDVRLARIERNGNGYSRPEY